MDSKWLAVGQNILDVDAEIEKLPNCKPIRGSVYLKNGARIMVWNGELVSGEFDENDSTFMLDHVSMSFGAPTGGGEKK